MAYTDYGSYWEVVYRAEGDGPDFTYNPPSDDYVWANQDGGTYAQAAPEVQNAVEADQNGDSSLIDEFVNGAKEISDLVNTVVQRLYSKVVGDASQFACVNVASIIADVPASGAICVTGDGKVIAAFGLGIPEATYIVGTTASGQPASDILLGGSFSVTLGNGEVGGVIVSIPSFDYAVVAGNGVSATPLPPPLNGIGGSVTWGKQVGTIGDSIFNDGWQGHEGGG